MQNLNPTRVVQRRGREYMIIGAFVLMIGMLCCGSSLIAFLLFSNQLFGYILVSIGSLIFVAGIGVLVRGLSLRMENQPALAVAEVLARELDARYTFVRNVSRRGVGYVDAVLVGPPGALVFRIVEQPGMFQNEGADWLERKGGQTYTLSRLNATRECVTDIYALRKYLAKVGLGTVPVFGVVVFTSSGAQITARQPVVPIADLRTLSTVLRRDFLAADRMDTTLAEKAVQAIYS